MSDERENYSKNGVRAGNPYEGTLPSVIGINRNVMWFPTCILSPQSKKQRDIYCKWETYDKILGRKIEHLFHFWVDEKDDSDGRVANLPTAKHAMYLDALFALYAHNLPPVGKGFYFNISDVAGILNLSNGGTFFETFYEALYRYNKCSARWDHSYMDGKHRVSVKAKGPFVAEFEKKEKMRENAASNRPAHVVLHHKIDETLRKGDTRLFFSKVMGMKLKTNEYIAYRYFYAFDDSKPVVRTVQDCAMAFNYNGEKKKFKAWLKKTLGALKDEHGLIESYEIPTDRSVEKFFMGSVSVKCGKQIRPKKRVEGIPIASMTATALFEEFLRLREQRKIKDRDYETYMGLKDMLAKDEFVMVLRRFLLTIEGEK